MVQAEMFGALPTESRRPLSQFYTKGERLLTLANNTTGPGTDVFQGKCQDGSFMDSRH